MSKIPKNVVRRKVSQGTKVKRQRHEKRLRNLGYYDPSEDEKRSNLERNIMLKNSK